jgi:hypothetical protein
MGSGRKMVTLKQATPWHVHGLKAKTLLLFW